MASPVASKKFSPNNKLEFWHHDPDGTSAAVTTPDAGTTERWFDMRDFGVFVAAAMAGALTGNGITKLEIVAADDVAGTNLTVIKDSGVLAADAQGDWAVEECTAEEVRQLSEDNGYNLRYVAARLTVQNAADEAQVVYLGCEPRFRRADLTPATTIA